MSTPRFAGRSTEAYLALGLMDARPAAVEQKRALVAPWVMFPAAIPAFKARPTAPAVHFPLLFSVISEARVKTVNCYRGRFDTSDTS